VSGAPLDVWKKTMGGNNFLYETRCDDLIPFWPRNCEFWRVTQTFESTRSKWVMRADVEQSLACQRVSTDSRYCAVDGKGMAIPSFSVDPAAFSRFCRREVKGIS